MIKSKYRRVWLIGRTLAGDEADQRDAFKLMNRYRLTRPNGNRFGLPADCYRGKGEPATYPTPTDGPGFVTSLNRALAKNPPPKRDGPILRELAPLGIGPGLSPEDAGLAPDVLAALYAGIERGGAGPARPGAPLVPQRLGRGPRLDHGRPTTSANFGTDYAYRALIAIVGIGANTPEEAMYPAALADSDGNLLDGSRSYRMAFPGDRLPPARYFWSLTMYDLNGFLVANPIDRYSLGPSHPPLLTQPDGSVVVVIQHDPPAEEGVNWLPAPEGPFRLNMRLYGPRKAALNWKWRPPPVVRQPYAAQPASTASRSRSRSSIRRIFPVSVFGSSSTNSTLRG